MTATGQHTPSRFDLDDEDRANATVVKRLTAAKPTTLIATTANSHMRTLAEQALAGVAPGTARAVFVNSPTTAREVAARLRASADPARQPPEVVVLTGRLREREAEDVRAALLNPATGVSAGALARNANGPSSWSPHRPLKLVQTWTSMCWSPRQPGCARSCNDWVG